PALSGHLAQAVHHRDPADPGTEPSGADRTVDHRSGRRLRLRHALDLFKGLPRAFRGLARRPTIEVALAARPVDGPAPDRAGADARSRRGRVYRNKWLSAGFQLTSQVTSGESAAMSSAPARIQISCPQAVRNCTVEVSPRKVTSSTRTGSPSRAPASRSDCGRTITCAAGKVPSPWGDLCTGRSATVVPSGKTTLPRPPSARTSAASRKFESPMKLATKRVAGL